MLTTYIINTIIFSCIFCLTSFGSQKDKEELTEKLQTKLCDYLDKKIKILPNEVRVSLNKCESENDLNKMDIEAQDWVNVNLNQIDDPAIAEIVKCFDEIRGGDDISQMLAETFWCRLNGKPLELSTKIERFGVYWLERDPPKVKFAPNGKGEIEWIWRLPVENRIYGILHVGLDLKTRKFLCYEQTVGVYYPEGDTLDRIRAEIVQDPILSGVYVGKGRLVEQKKAELPSVE